MQAGTIEILKAIFGSLFAILWTLVWVHFSSQAKVPRSIRTSLAIIIRLITVQAIAYAGFCAWIGVPVDILLGVTVVILILSPIASLDDSSGASVLGTSVMGFAIVIIVLLPIFILKQFVLGFPEYGNVVLIPPQSNTRTRQEDLSVDGTELSRQKPAVVVSTLRPMGTIECDGARLPATSVDGSLISIGAAVYICGKSNGILVVKSLSNAKALND